MPLQGALHLLVLARGDVFSDGFRRPLHFFSGNLHASQQLHLLGATLKGSIVAEGRQHPPYSRRFPSVVHVQFLVDGKLPLTTVGAQIVGTPQFHRAPQRRNQSPGTQADVPGRVAARAGQLAMILVRLGVLQQGAQGRCSHLVQSQPEGHFHGLQIGVAGLMALSKDAAQPSMDFPRRLLMEDSSRFFSCAVQPPRCGATGRRAQIFSLTATSFSLSCWKRRNSPTSCWALRKAAGLGKPSAIVLPATLRVSRNWGSWPGSLGRARNHRAACHSAGRRR